ncbi:MAG: lactate racemase domain-containing protein [Syntrophales bacterium]|jgi:nickel-dependent lactate racemase|nr:lactate racemase domain-containing protein [Syntrophales bacterium]MDY0045105.1 lactate racemase domain-containing protein [Syntrophales bacterium]
MKTLSVPSRLWYENEERRLTFPGRWDVDNLTSPGLDKPGLAPDEIREKVRYPIKGPALREMARGKKQAVIVFDDMTRPTPVKDVAPFVLEELHEAGLRKDQIRFIWALGTHGAYDMINARKKLGDYIVENYAVYNHDPFQNTVRIGRTTTGVELWLNREYLSCDLRIGIGCITAHVHVGFGGGGKIILPGIAGIESINQFHNQLHRDQSRTGLGNFDNNIMRAECDAAGELAALNFKVDCLINRRGEIANLYAGPFTATHAAGAEEGKDHYGIPYASGYDIAVCNSYAKANESAIALLMSLMALKSDGTGTAVLISDAPEGQVPHYVMRAWGTDYGGRHHVIKNKGEKMITAFMKRLIVFTPCPDKTMLDLICHIDDAVVVKTWSEVMALLEEAYPEYARVAVVQDGTMQYMKPPNK